MEVVWDHLSRMWPPIVVFLAIWWPIVIIVSKTGFPRWFGWIVALACTLLGILSWVAGAACLFTLLWILATREWPVWRQLTYARVHGGIGSEEDAYAILERAVRLERKGRWEEAVRLLEEVLAGFPGKQPGVDASIALERMRSRQGKGAR